MSEIKTKYSVEFQVRSSITVLWNMISTPSGFSEWFCNDVHVKDNKYIFIWENSEEIAALKAKRNNEFIRFQWEDDEDTDYFFELHIMVDPITKEVALVITDFAEADEIEESQLLWENQVAELKSVLGS